jgi:hypothetical protein
VRGYLLAAANPRSRGKPAFFQALGFGPQNWEMLRDFLLGVAAAGEAVEVPRTPFGRKFEIHATLTGPSGRAASVCTIWIIESGELSPRFVTAYPT